MCGCAERRQTISQAAQAALAKVKELFGDGGSEGRNAEEEEDAPKK